MAHKVKIIEMPSIELTGNDLKFEIKKNSEKIGELLISKGNVEWWPRGNKRYKKRLTWSQFQFHMEQWGRQVKN
jgi:hypothetical protein